MPEASPILNNPYERPERYYATNLDGELDYDRVIEGRRLFTGRIHPIPIQAGDQTDLLNAQEEAEREYGSHLINLLRKEVSAWRKAEYPNTTRVTRELLHFWFLNENRDNIHRLFFAQREAVETAIFLNEVAEKSNPGQNILRMLSEAQAVGSDPASNLPRLAFKMATGTGKTVVMGALIVYHFFNRLEYRADTRFADNFLIVTPGVTIRDRLSVLRFDSRKGGESEDYYHQRYLIPNKKGWRDRFAQVNSRIVITNYHAFEPKNLSGNKRGVFDGKRDATGKKVEARENFNLVARRLLAKFKAGSRLLVLNDEAHHCYLPKSGDRRKAEGEDTKEENARAAVWFTGLRELARRYKIRSVYDLSATPYYLTGSGYEPYSLFPWTVSDFGLIEAIESGLTKIPFLPTKDDAQAIEMPVLRNLYDHVKTELPKAGQKTKRKRAKAKGQALAEEPPQLPELVKTALAQFYEHYEQEFRDRRHSLDARESDQTEFGDAPPVFIVVCNNTSVSKEVYKYVAGYEAVAANGAPAKIVPGHHELFSNYDLRTRQAHRKPSTLLIDSDALENSDQINAEFKKIFAPEIEQFKADYARVYGSGAAERITEAEILREVVNTVGKPGALGGGIRCVVSVSMLTEGWDANTVTHIMGIRAFGSQLLCEQVAGRALRRRNYFLKPYDHASGKALPQDTRKKKGVIWKFPPEYAHIIGVPFKLFKGGAAPEIEPLERTRVFALAERTVDYEIEFPNLEGYRLEYPDEPLSADFSGIEDYEIDGSKLPIKTILANAISADERELDLDEILEEVRDRSIVYRIAKDVLRDHFPCDTDGPQFHRFHELVTIVEQWFTTKVRVLGRGEEYKKLLYFADPRATVAHVARGLRVGGADSSQRVRPIFNYYNPSGSSRYVVGASTRETYPTRHSHVNRVVIDSGWEGEVAKILDDLAEDDGPVEAWVKNAFLQFTVPYTDKTGRERDYEPDFIVRARTPSGGKIHLVVEVTGERRDKVEKAWTMRERWLPAVNNTLAAHDSMWACHPWAFTEITDNAEARDDLLKALETNDLAPGFGTWKGQGIDPLEYQRKLRAEWDRETTEV